MIFIIKKIYNKQLFFPDWIFGIWVNPFFIIRKGLLDGVIEISSLFVGGKLLDLGCGSKPYRSLFHVDEYIGVDVVVSGHDHSSSNVDFYYDGEFLPFNDESYDWVFSTEVFEHLFNPEQILDEINRVLKKGGCLALTCPFVWDEHEEPYDFARYTSFAIKFMLEKHGFEVLKYQKSTNYFETLMQMFSAYIWQHCLPRQRFVRLILTPFFVSPFNMVGIMLGKVLPRSDSFYHSNIVIARKL